MIDFLGFISPTPPPRRVSSLVIPMLSLDTGFFHLTASIDTHANDSRSLEPWSRSERALRSRPPWCARRRRPASTPRTPTRSASARPPRMTTPRKRPNLPSRVRKPLSPTIRRSPRRTASRSRGQTRLARLRADPSPRVPVPVPRAAIRRSRLPVAAPASPDDRDENPSSA